VQFQKISILPPQKGLEFPGMKVNWNFQRGGRVRKNPFHEGGMDILILDLHVFLSRTVKLVRKNNI